MTFWGIGIAVVVLGGAALAVGFAVGLYNTLVQVAGNCDKSWHNIDVLLQQRHDELFKLVEACRGHMRHETELLTRIVALRTGYDGATNVNDKVRAENELSAAVARLQVNLESYPELQASRSFLQLQERVSALESAVADRRELFNDSVNIFNVRIASFPDLLVARMLGHCRRDFLVVPEAARRDVTLEFADAAAPITA